MSAWVYPTAGNDVLDIDVVKLKTMFLEVDKFIVVCGLKLHNAFAKLGIIMS